MNQLPSSKTLTKWALILASFLIVASILWNTNQFFRKFKNEERLKMEVLATAYENFNNADLDIDVSLEEKIIQSNRSIPMIITFENGDINRWANLDVENDKKFTALDVDDRLYLSRQLKIMMAENDPLVVNFQLDNVNITEKIYYRNSDLLNKLQYYPLGLLLILFLFGSIIYLAFKYHDDVEKALIVNTNLGGDNVHRGALLGALLGAANGMESIPERWVRGLLQPPPDLSSDNEA